MAVVVVVAPVFMVDAIASAHVLETPHDYGCAPGDFTLEETAMAAGDIAGLKPYLDPVVCGGRGHAMDDETSLADPSSNPDYEYSAPISEIAARTMMLLGFAGLACARFSQATLKGARGFVGDFAIRATIGDPLRLIGNGHRRDEFGDRRLPVFCLGSDGAAGRNRLLAVGPEPGPNVGPGRCPAGDAISGG
jgi:hypothetical protein